MGAGWAGYARTARARGVSPWEVATDLTRWVRVVNVREKPQWTHPHEVRREWPVARLLDFSEPADAGLVPTLVIPPQAGHASTVVDHDAGQSQIITLRSAGLAGIYCLDWLGATRETRHTGVQDYLQIIAESIELLGGRVNLVGDCQGGWLATIYAALHPEQINTLTVAGAPIDCRAGSTLVQHLSRATPYRVQKVIYRALVRAQGGVHRGRSQLAFFKMLDPLGELERTMAVLPRIHDTTAVQRHIRFTNWFEWTQDLPGAFYLWAVTHLFAANELARGKLVIDGARVDLTRIDCPLFLIAGSRDQITPAPQVLALAGMVGTPPGSITTRVVDSGHIGLFMGRDTLEGHWAPLMAKVRVLSTRPQPVG
jgi:poly(3-hydroxyalkanoate) synthetase